MSGAMMSLPTLFDEATGHFRQDLREAEDVSYEEALAELRAQMSLFHRYLGKAPDTMATMSGQAPFAKALYAVCRENGVVMNYASSDAWFNGNHYVSEAAPEWKDRNIWMLTDPESMRGVFTDSIKEQYETYDTLDYFLHRSQMLLSFPEDAVVIQPWHPGVVDYYVAKQSDKGDAAMNFLYIRAVDLHALCSDELKDWIVENRIELINQRDALYGTHEYQNHLRETGSKLYMRG